MSERLVELTNVTKRFDGFSALNGINLTIVKGEFVAIVGKSGSGKSTLLNILGGIDSPSSGEVMVNGKLLHRMDQDEIAVWRGRNVGVVFQFFQLLPTLSVVENVILPMDFCNVIPSGQHRKRAGELLEMLGISDQADKLPATLSGGQQQRAAIARALANDPPILLADEPTGNLDSETSESVLHILSELSSSGKTVIVVTHEREIAGIAKRRIALSDGTIAAETTSAGALRV